MAARYPTVKLHGEPWVELLVHVFRGGPNLRGALCVGKSELFDHHDSRFEAARICARCPVRLPCRTYASKARRLTGTWAGVYRNHGDDETETETDNVTA
ncbi:hypothetical protein FHR72_001719 [Mycolicibacterium iranicum]|uniref:4Fe-4S Wbl-type domain-containing protein n=1 Tax=Mycolicibacterium iranicum TaxID=912594 RepID=A0A839QCL2_MYCIR|nr:hypothetical protein [Mycolicibacterium iranicum]